MNFLERNFKFSFQFTADLKGINWTFKKIFFDFKFYFLINWLLLIDTGKKEFLFHDRDYHRPCSSKRILKASSVLL